MPEKASWWVGREVERKGKRDVSACVCLFFVWKVNGGGRLGETEMERQGDRQLVDRMK